MENLSDAYLYSLEFERQAVMSCFVKKIINVKDARVAFADNQASECGSVVGVEKNHARIRRHSLVMRVCLQKKTVG
jgi:hypothetical protein